MNWKFLPAPSPRCGMVLVAVCSAATTALIIRCYCVVAASCPSRTHCGASLERKPIDAERHEVREVSPSPRERSTDAAASSTEERLASVTHRSGSEDLSPSVALPLSTEQSRRCNLSNGDHNTVITTMSSKGNNLVHEACLLGDVEALRLACRDALEEGLAQCFTACNSMGYTPLHVAADTGHVGCLRELLRHSPDLVRLEVADPRGLTPLALASGRGHEGCVKLLLDAGADPNAASLRGFTALHLACESGASKPVVELLLDHGANSESRSRRGSTPLFVAAQHGHVDVVNVLLSRGSSVGATHDSGATPLFIAAQNGHADVVRVLLSQDPHRRISRSTACGGYTPLHVACDRGHTAVVKVMLCFGRCNPDLVTSSGRTALHLAAARGYHEIVSLLVREGCHVDARIPTTGETALHLAKKLEQGADTIAALLGGGCSTVLKPRSSNIPGPPPQPSKASRVQKRGIST